MKAWSKGWKNVIFGVLSSVENDLCFSPRPRLLFAAKLLSYRERLLRRR